jgi:hypothetical protein
MIELLAVDWDDRDHPSVIQSIPSFARRLGDANMVARSLLEDAKRASPNAYRIKDEDGNIVLRSWERVL